MRSSGGCAGANDAATALGRKSHRRAGERKEGGHILGYAGYLVPRPLSRAPCAQSAIDHRL